MSAPTKDLVLLSDAERAAMEDGAHMLREAAKRLNPEWGMDVAQRMEEMRRNAERLEQLARWGKRS